MIVCNLQKPEATLDQVRKSYPKLQHTDAAQLSAALAISGKYADAHYDGQKYSYPNDVPKLTKALSVELNQIQIANAPEPSKKRISAAAAAQALEDEIPVEINLGLSCSATEGEKLLGSREDLKTLLSDILQEGVEFQFGPTDVLWQWALDRANWNTVSGGDLTRRVKLRTHFQDSTIGTDLGISGKKKAPRAKAKAAPVVEAEEVEAAAVVDTEESVPE